MNAVPQNASPSRAKILVVDDTPANLFAMRRLLSQVDADIVEAESGNEALALCLDHRFALILLDVNMPDMDGYEVAGLLAEEPEQRDTPVIFVTAAYADDINRLKGYHSGAVDYIAKPINDAILLSKVRVFLELYARKAELAAALASLEQRNEQLNAEIAERRRIEEQMRHQATHDILTGLPNRGLFIDTLDRMLSRSARRVEPCALLYIDIDGFKAVNDTHGHQAGDVLLQAIAQRLQDGLRAEDLVARLGGDEFAALLEGVAEPADALAKAEELGKALRLPYELAGKNGLFDAHVGASIGVALYPQHAEGRDALIHAADHAMYEAKRGGNNNSRLAQAA